MTWIVVPNWDKFQHYRDRRPVWIKLYTELAHKDEWLHLPMSTRGVLVTIWLEYAATDGVLRTDTLRTLIGHDPDRRVSELKALRRSLVRLSEAGFIELSASKPLATRARAREGAGEETEKETPKSPLRKPQTRITGWRLVRGSHGMTHVPDPNGTDRPPADARL